MLLSAPSHRPLVVEMDRIDSRVRSKSVIVRSKSACAFGADIRPATRHLVPFGFTKSAGLRSAGGCEVACDGTLFQGVLMGNLLVLLAYQILAARSGLAPPAFSDWLRQVRFRRRQRSAAPGFGARRRGGLRYARRSNGTMRSPPQQLLDLCVSVSSGHPPAYVNSDRRVSFQPYGLMEMKALIYQQSPDLCRATRAPAR